MREILFRGKAINRNRGYHKTKYKNGDWVYGLVTRLYDEQFENLPAEMTNTDGVSGIEIDYKSISEFTGLTDKNGKNIFEGDILKYKNFISKYNIGYVVYGKGCFSVKDIHSDNRPAIDIVLHESKNDIEIIGNIHDNPELLKGEQ